MDYTSGELGAVNSASEGGSVMGRTETMGEVTSRFFHIALVLVWASFVVTAYVYCTLTRHWDRIWDWLSKVLVG